MLLLGPQGGLTVQQEVAVATDRTEYAVGEARIDLDDAIGHGLQEPAVVADGHQREGRVGQFAFQPQHAFQIKVVGWLVQQQHLGFLQEGADDGQALLPTAGQTTDAHMGAGESGLSEGDLGGDFGLVGIMAAGHQGGSRHADDGGLGVESLLLRYIDQAQTTGYGAVAGIRRIKTREDLQQRRFTGPVRANQTNTFTVIDAEGQVLKEGADTISLA